MELQNTQTALSPRQAARELRKAEWHAADQARRDAWTQARANSFEAPISAGYAAGQRVDLADIGAVVVANIGKAYPRVGGWHARVYWERVTDAAPVVAAKPAKPVKASVAVKGANKSADFWAAVQRARAKFNASHDLEPAYAATPSYARKLAFVNHAGIATSVKQPATFRCPPARFWDVVPAGLIFPVEVDIFSLDRARNSARLCVANFYRFRSYLAGCEESETPEQAWRRQEMLMSIRAGAVSALATYKSLRRQYGKVTPC